MPDGDNSLGKLLLSISPRGDFSHAVAIRAMLWHNTIRDPQQNKSTVDFLAQLGNGWAIWDSRHRIGVGSHHQKFLVANTSKGLVAYCGGIDMHPARWGWNDVQCRVTGEAAEDILRTFEERWNDHPDAADAAKHGRVLVPFVPPRDRPAVTGPLAVQVVRTFGRLGGKVPWLPSLQPSPYSFAPRGETTIYQLILNAIAQTKAYIYMQDQYLVESEEIAHFPSLGAALAAKLREPTFRWFVALIARSESLDLYQPWLRHEKFINQLKAVAPEKVLICQYKIVDPEIVDTNNPTYVHAKTWTFDDQFAIVGSANSNRRGYTHDSEIDIGVFDPNTSGDRLNFAKELRIQQWLAAHKEMPDGRRPSHADLADFDRAIDLWRRPDTSSPIEPYNPSPYASAAVHKNLDTSLEPWLLKKLLQVEWAPGLLAHRAFDLDFQWRNLIDPDGQ
jgi:phosphatidylserine/phosphatidylglycerophosphate/cardiolipin synthase-like enzyme